MPDAPDTHRGEFKEIKTTCPACVSANTCPSSKVADKFAICEGLVTRWPPTGSAPSI